jgi:hypothetical protein
MSGIDPAVLAALDALAANELALHDEIAEITADRDTYREVALAAIEKLAEETRQHAATRQQLDRVRDEYRTLRARLMREPSAA